MAVTDPDLCKAAADEKEASNEEKVKAVVANVDDVDAAAGATAVPVIGIPIAEGYAEGQAASPLTGEEAEEQNEEAYRDLQNWMAEDARQENVGFQNILEDVGIKRNSYTENNEYAFYFGPRDAHQNNEQRLRLRVAEMQNKNRRTNSVDAIHIGKVKITVKTEEMASTKEATFQLNPELSPQSDGTSFDHKLTIDYTDAMAVPQDIECDKYSDEYTVVQSTTILGHEGEFLNVRHPKVFGNVIMISPAKREAPTNTVHFLQVGQVYKRTAKASPSPLKPIARNSPRTRGVKHETGSHSMLGNSLHSGGEFFCLMGVVHGGKAGLKVLVHRMTRNSDTAWDPDEYCETHGIKYFLEAMESFITPVFDATAAANWAVDRKVKVDRWFTTCLANFARKQHARKLKYEEEKKEKKAAKEKSEAAKAIL